MQLFNCRAAAGQSTVEGCQGIILLRCWFKARELPHQEVHCSAPYNPIQSYFHPERLDRGALTGVRVACLQHTRGALKRLMLAKVTSMYYNAFPNNTQDVSSRVECPNVPKMPQYLRALLLPGQWGHALVGGGQNRLVSLKTCPPPTQFCGPWCLWRATHA